MIGWLIHAFDSAAGQTDVLKHGQEEAGLLNAITSAFDDNNVRD